MSPPCAHCLLSFCPFILFPLLLISDPWCTPSLSYCTSLLSFLSDWHLFHPFTGRSTERFLSIDTVSCVLHLIRFPGFQCRFSVTFQVSFSRSQPFLPLPPTTCSQHNQPTLTVRDTDSGGSSQATHQSCPRPIFVT